MLISNPDLINSCRVCRSPNQDGDYECLYEVTRHEEEQQLSPSGKLYENLLDISLDSMEYYPQFLCNSCDLQMKLFKKLKDKALRTLEYLQNLYEEEEKKTTKDIINEAFEAIDDEYIPNEEECIIIGNEQYRVEENMNLINAEHEEEDMNLINAEQEEEDINLVNSKELGEEQQKIRIITKEEQHEGETYSQSQLESQLYHNQQYGESDMYVNNNEEQQKEEVDRQQEQILQSYTEEQILESLPSSTNHNESQSFTIPYENSYTEDETLEDNEASSITDFFQIKLESQDVIDNSDYVTEIYELMEDDPKTEQYSVTTEHLQEDECYVENKAESSIAFSDIEYVESTNMNSNDDVEMADEIMELNPPKRRKGNNTKRTKTTMGTPKKKDYRCGPCNEEFRTSQEYKKHRSLMHDEKYPCNICFKLLNSQPALYTHMRIHTSKPFQCEICQKTFNQKVHYQYHMNHHNNIRNFKCEVCDKAFITKTDLNVHMRFHTGQRPYVCDICGKDYLLMEHLKAHSFIHTKQKFQCELCQHKFSTHKTLSQHMKTMHAEEPKFKCEICLKPFRRKHHLEYHSRLHEKDINLLDNHYEIIDDPDMPKADDNEYVADDDFVDQVDFVEDSGFVVLNDDAIIM